MQQREFICGGMINLMQISRKQNIEFVDVYGGPFISFWNPDNSTIDLFNLSIKCDLIIIIQMHMVL